MFTEGKSWNTAQTAQTGLFHHEFTKVCRFPPFSEYAQAFQMGAWETPAGPRNLVLQVFWVNISRKYSTCSIDFPFYPEHRVPQSVSQESSGVSHQVSEPPQQWSTAHVNHPRSACHGSGHHRARALADLGLLVHHGRAACRGENFAVEDEKTGANHFSIFFWAIKSTTRNWFWNAFIMWTPWVPANNQIFPPSFSAFIPLDLCAASRRMGYHGIPHIAIDYHWC